MSNDRFSMFNVPTVDYNNRKVKNINSSLKWEEFIKNLESYKYRYAVIPNGMAGRPDLISFDVYGTVDYWWLILVVNQITDPFEQLVAGKQIRLPIINR